MTVQDHQRVSYEVQKLHSKTLDPKLMRGGTVDAIGFARDAYKKVVGDRDNAVHFRKVVQRANEAIQTLTDDGDLKLHNERGRAAPYVLTDKIDFLVLRTS